MIHSAQDARRRTPPLLVRQTMSRAAKLFSARGHYPSSHMLDALAAIPTTAHAIINGEAEAAYYVCPLDTGVGKTTTLSETIRALRSQGDDTGVVICAGRLMQIEALIADMNLRPHEFAVLVADTEDNRHLTESGLGIERINEAPILLTTHAMIERRLSSPALKIIPGEDNANPVLAFHTTSYKILPGGVNTNPVLPWSEARDFFYRGRPRQLRIWDETCLPGRPLVLDKSEVYRVMDVLRRDRIIVRMLEGLLEEMRAAHDHAIYLVPDFAEVIPLQDVLGSLSSSDRDYAWDAVSKVWMLGGHIARFRQDHPGDDHCSILNYRQRLPEDIKPMIVLDASARVRATYNHQRRTMGDVRQTQDAEKRYDRVTINVHKGPSGRNGLVKNFKRRVNELASIVNAHGPDSSLVVHHKPGGGVKSIPKAMRPLVNPEARPAFMSWGSHNATNEFRDR